MALFLTSYNSWFYLTILLLILIKFISEHVFRIGNKRKDSNGFIVERNEKRDETRLKFKFDYPRSTSTTINCEEDTEGKTTNISKYCFMSEEDYGGFVQNPGFATFQVHGSFSDYCIEKSAEVIMSKDDDAEELSAYDSNSDSDSLSLTDGCFVKNDLEYDQMFVSDQVKELKMIKLPRFNNVDGMVKEGKETKLKKLENDELSKEYENVWEHDDLIDQLKRELKKVKGFGLATIYEESESPKSIEDLKPWKSDENMFMVNMKNDLHKYHRSYKEIMRRLDVLNYEKMYSICFLNLKDPPGVMHKPAVPSIVSNVFFPYHNKSNSDSSKKYMKEVQSYLELVYVGQTCISWEILCWQYEKAREIQSYDPYRYYQFNQVAAEFQHFQVILQRFIDNECLQGTRLQNYVKNRCVLQTLLQVPLITEDRIEDRKICSDAITSEKLHEIMEESIRVFWQFVKTDRDETSTLFKGLIRNPVQHRNSIDFTLMSNILTVLHKKEKKLKEILKAANCVVKKLKKTQENRLNCQVLKARIDMKLISRVMKMTRITNHQLLWCSKKLNNISFEDGKIHRVSSFLLFPC